MIIERALIGGNILARLAQLAVSGALERSELVVLATPFLDLKRTLYPALHRCKFIAAIA